MYGANYNNADVGCSLRIIMIGVGIFVLVIMFALSQSPKDVASHSSGLNVVSLGAIPDDVCIENGIPQISTFSIDNDDVHLGYVSRKGLIVLSVYVKDAVNASWQQLRLKYTLTGGSCHDDRDNKEK